MSAESVARELAECLAADLGPGGSLGGGLVLSTAAAGDHGVEVARELAGRWPEAALFGTSFEGVLVGGRTYRDEPAWVVLGWSEDAREPAPFLLDPGLTDPDRIANEILCHAGRSALDPSDLVLLFPDALGSTGFEPLLARLGPLLGQPWIAGSAACGIDGHPAAAFFGSEAEPGATLGLLIPGRAGSAPVSSGAVRPRVRRAGASRRASDWLEVSDCRSPWIDRLEGEPSLVWVRRQLGLTPDAPVEPHLDRLLVRVRGRGAGDADFDERDVVGLDHHRGSLSVSMPIARGDRIALALPDPDRAREDLRRALTRLACTPMLLQFACRARNEDLYGDPDLESAWVAHHSPGRQVLGTVAPFQLGGEEPGQCRVLVHSTLLVALGEEADAGQSKGTG